MRTAATGKLCSRFTAAEHARFIGWFEVQTAGGPITLDEWIKSGYRGELLEFISERACAEVCPDGLTGAVWTFGNFS